MVDAKKEEMSVVNIDEKTEAQIKHENKLRWIRDIMLKDANDIPLNGDDISFMINMNLSDNNKEYGKITKIQSELMDIELKKMKDELSPKDYFKLRLGNLNLKATLDRVSSQGRRDEAATHKMTVDSIERYSKLKSKFKDKRNIAREELEAALRGEDVIDVENNSIDSVEDDV